MHASLVFQPSLVVRSDPAAFRINSLVNHNNVNRTADNNLHTESHESRCTSITYTAKDIQQSTLTKKHRKTSLPEPSVPPATNHNQYRPGRDIINMSFPREKNVRCTWCITPNGHAIDISMTRPLRHRDVAFDTPRLSTGSPHEQDDSHRVLPLVHETSVLPGTPILCSRSSPLP